MIETLNPTAMKVTTIVKLNILFYFLFLQAALDIPKFYSQIM